MKTNMILAIALCAVLVGCGVFSRNGRSESRDIATARAEAMNFGGDVRAVCGSKSILGVPEKSFSKGACGITNPVRVYAVDGIKLSTPALVNCQTAGALNNWVRQSARPNAAFINKKLSELKVVASYACRNRNHKKGGKLSEHAKGNAVDIAGFKFTDGSDLSVKAAYYKYKKYFQSVRRQACGPFGTVLGPGVALHDDHFHFDTASYRSGPYCK